MRPAAIVPGIALAVGIAVLGAVPSGDALDVDAATRRLLTGDFEFSATDFSDLANGRIVRRTLDASGGELAAVGATRIDVPVSRFLSKFRDIASFKKHQNVLQI